MQRRRVQIRLFVLQRLRRRRERTRKARCSRDKCADHPRSSIPEDWVVEVVGHKLETHHPVIEPVSDIRVGNGISRCRDGGSRSAFLSCRDSRGDKDELEKARCSRDKCAYHPRSSIPEDWVVETIWTKLAAPHAGIEPSLRNSSQERNFLLQRPGGEMGSFASIAGTETALTREFGRHAFENATDIAAAEILQGVKTEIGIPRAAAAVHDGFAIRVQTRRAEYLLDAVLRDEILGIFVAQNFRRIADADGARNVSFGICIGSSYVPNNGISRDSLGDIVAIDDGGGRGQGGLRPQERQRNEYQTFHDEPSVSSLLSSELSKTVYHVSSSNPNQFRTGRTADEGRQWVQSRRSNRAPTTSGLSQQADLFRAGRHVGFVQQRTHALQHSLSIRSPRRHGRATLARYRTRTPSPF